MGPDTTHNISDITSNPSRPSYHKSFDV